MMTLRTNYQTLKATNDFKSFEFDLIRYSITSPVSESEFAKTTEMELEGKYTKKL
jgi:preprotein translocase subunit SecA